MKCKLESYDKYDNNFQVEFDTITEIIDLRDSLTHMIKYMRECQEDGEELPPLIYKIKSI